jgi:lysophospholipase L1-like esterase
MRVTKHIPKQVPQALAGLALLLTSAATASAAGTDTYLALGDSYAWGFTTTANAFNQNVSNYFGLQGYVPAVSAALGAQQTISLAIPGETTTSYVAGGNANVIANFNYGFTDGIKATDSQETALGDVVSAETLAGHTISDITVQLGGNDLLDAVFSDPTLLTQSFAAKEAFIGGKLQTLGTNYAGVLGAIHANPALAATSVYVIGYFDPFADLPQDPFGLDPFGNQVSGDVIQALNETLEQDATAFGFKFVDPYAAFRAYPGNHNDLSYINAPPEDPLNPFPPNFHPKTAGYALYAQQIEAAGAVPEASSAVSFGLLLALGMGGVMVVARRKKNARP